MVYLPCFNAGVNAAVICCICTLCLYGCYLILLTSIAQTLNVEGKSERDGEEKEDVEVTLEVSLILSLVVLVLLGSLDRNTPIVTTFL